jgi:hypothetical protein
MPSSETHVGASPREARGVIIRQGGSAMARGRPNEREGVYRERKGAVTILDG